MQGHARKPDTGLWLVAAVPCKLQVSSMDTGLAFDVRGCEFEPYQLL